MCRSQAGWDTSLTGDAVGRDVVAMAFAAHGGHRFLSACIQSERLHDVAVVLELREDLEPRGGRGSSTGNRQDAEKDRVSARVSRRDPFASGTLDFGSDTAEVMRLSTFAGPTANC